MDLKWNPANDNFGVTGHKIYRNGVELATIGPDTRYSDATGTPGSTYDYEVTALDAAAHESARSNLVAVATFLFHALADARVEEASPTTNFGTSPQLRADGGSDPDVQSYLRFNVTGVSGPVQRAVLQLYSTSHTSNGPTVFRTSNGWTETGPGSITWASKPAPTSGPLDDKGDIPVDRYVEWNVTSLVNSSGLHHFMLATTSSNGANFNSREASIVARRPRLYVTP